MAVRPMYGSHLHVSCMGHSHPFLRPRMFRIVQLKLLWDKLPATAGMSKGFFAMSGSPAVALSNADWKLDHFGWPSFVRRTSH